MKRDEIHGLIEGILNEKLQLMLGRIDLFQNSFISQIDHLKQLDELVQFEVPAAIHQESDEAGTVASLHHTVKEIAGAANQLGLITSLLEGINVFCRRSALFLLREDKLVGWRGRGFSGKSGEIGDEDIKKVFFSLSANTIFSKVLHTKTAYQGEPLAEPDDFLIYNRFGGEKPREVFVLPFFVKGKPQAVIYTDSGEDRPIRPREIEIVAMVGELSLDLLPLKQKILSRVKTQEFIEGPEPADATPLPTPPPMQIPVPPLELEKTEPPRRETEANRYARVIISDIILYNQQMVDEGIKNKNLFATLKETLIQARDEYLRKYNDLTPFEEQLVKTLARGDRDVLRGYPFEIHP